MLLDLRSAWEGAAQVVATPAAPASTLDGDAFVLQEGRPEIPAGGWERYMARERLRVEGQMREVYEAERASSAELLLAAGAISDEEYLALVA